MQYYHCMRLCVCVCELSSCVEVQKAYEILLSAHSIVPGRGQSRKCIYGIQVSSQPGHCIVYGSRVVLSLSERRLCPSGKLFLFDAVGRGLDDLLRQCCHVNLKYQQQGLE